jgi:hypothetical protein
MAGDQKIYRLDIDGQHLRSQRELLFRRRNGCAQPPPSNSFTGRGKLAGVVHDPDLCRKRGPSARIVR